MTVAAVILCASPDEALVDSAGRPAVRRMVESAWAGGATPIVVVCPDSAGRVAVALAGSPAVLAEPAPNAGAAAQLLRGAHVAGQRVSEIGAVLAWPAAMVWVDAETVTTLIEAHGARRSALLRPRYADHPGWPVLVRYADLHQVAADASAEGAPVQDLERFLDTLGRPQLVDTGDPGAVLDNRTAIDQLPAYAGPPQPVAGSPPEWGPTAADWSDEGPLQGPALAPYGQAAQDDE